MRHGVWVVLPVLLSMAVVACVADWLGGPQLPGSSIAGAAEKEGKTAGGLPPLVIDKGAPLLLDAPPEEDPLDVPQGPLANNTACFVCHTNYEEEPFAVEHAKVNVGCVKCHGESFAHRDDEDNITPPDTMYGPEKIESNCRKCHDVHDAPAAEVIARWQQRCPAKTNPKEIVCTDCHGQHRLKVRTVWWDKKTRKLIIRKEDERVKVAPDLTAKGPGGKPCKATDPDSKKK